MKKISIALGVGIAIMTSAGAYGASGGNSGYIADGDFENGIRNFGICYSSREDTKMPSVYECTDFSFNGGRSLALIPDETLLEEKSTSPLSMGFSYQGIYHKDAFRVLKDTSYNISAKIYSETPGVKARFVAVADSKAVAVSEEFSVTDGSWNNLTYKWTAKEAIKNVRIRIALYNIEENKSIYIDDFTCNQSIISNFMWKPENTETITASEDALIFNATANRRASIYCMTDKQRYTNGAEYAVKGTASTDADKAYLSVSIGDISGCHGEYILSKDQAMNFVLPFNIEDTSASELTCGIAALADSNAKINLENLEIVDKYSVVNVSQSDKSIVVSGQLRSGNENTQIKIDISGIGNFTVNTDANGSYILSKSIPAFEDANKKVAVTVSQISGYDDAGNTLEVDFVIKNQKYANEIAALVDACTTGAQVKNTLTVETLDNLGITATPVFVSADQDFVFKYLSQQTITSGAQLVSELEAASALSCLNKKTQKLSNVMDEYADQMIGGSQIAAYTDIYPNISDKDLLNSMFAESTASISDADTLKYAITEVLVRYEIQSKNNYSQQIKVFEKYAGDLDIDLAAYKGLSSDKQYYVASELMNYMKDKADYSGLQTVINNLIENTSTNNGGTGGSSSGRGGGIGGSKDKVAITPETDAEDQLAYKFTDLTGFDWAANEIYALVESGVISKPSDQNFNPDTSITRAEFAKMVSAMFNITGYTGESAFSDVTPDDWYYQYVMALNEKGIVNGISENSFGSEDYITRQDICVILSRVLNDSEYEQNTEFIDIDAADEYARESIRRIKGLGFINGYEDGSFQPHNFATRAEVAKILYNINNN